MNATSELVTVVVTLEDASCGQIEDVAARLHASGMNVENIMKPLGVIVGSVETSKRDALSRIKGVAHVEASRQFQLAPPESKVR